MLTALIVHIVDLSRRFAVLIVLLALAMAGGCGWFAVTHFKINTDINQLLSSELKWRKQEADMDKAFPQKTDVLLIVIDGDNSFAAETAAAALANRLSAMPDKFLMVERLDSIPFFRQNGLMFLSRQELSSTLDEIVQAQPILGTLASDPSLRGFFSTIGLTLQGYQLGQVNYNELDKPFTAIADTIEAAIAGHDKPLALESLTTAGKASPRDLRKLIVTRPKLDYAALEPGKAASDIIRQAAADMQLTPEHGVHIRLTGSVALNDEEFASVANGTGGATILSGVLVIVLLLIALRSLRIVFAIILTLATGLAITTAFALLAVGSLNLISVAFAVMFIGIAVDFGIQFGVRYRDQHFHEPDHAKAMLNTAMIIALPLAMAAGSTTLGFLAFIPTAYRGVSELGLIAGAGMAIAFMLNITLLPALLTLMPPPPEPEAVGYKWAAPADRFLIKHRWVIVAVAFVIAVSGGLAVTKLRFDFDPLDLKDPKTESVSTLLDLMKDPDFGAYNINVLKPSLTSAKDLADRLGELPEVDHVMTLASFVPDDQITKFAMITDTNALLGPALSMPQVPAPDDAANLESLDKISTTLHEVGKEHDSAERLARALDEVVKRHDHQFLARLHQNIITVLYSRLEGIKDLLNAQRITPESISDDLRRDWVTPDGRYLVQVYPKGNPRDYKTLLAFTNAVRHIASDASGTPISIQESGHTVTSAFIHAGIYAVIAITILLMVILRRIGDVLRLLTPLILAGILTLATIVAIGLPLNFANIIALPLLLSLGVSYAVYFVSYWRAGSQNPLQSSMARAVLFSAATVLVAFGSLALSSHPGTAGMGKLLTVALIYSLLSTFFILPVLLGVPKNDKG